MKKFCCIALACSAVLLSQGACSETPREEAASVGEFAPLSDFYDNVWVRGSNAESTTLDQVAKDLSEYDVVFFGEYHGHSGVHLAQMKLFRALHDQHPAMTLSMEQFERDTQKYVDQYLAGEIGEKVLEKDGRAWDNYAQSYRPMVEYAKNNELPVLASNAPKSIVICVGKEGPELLDRLPEPDRGWAARELHLGEGAYLDKYRNFVMSNASHGSGSSASEADEETAKRMEAMVMRSFAAQVTRDDTMAESIAMHIQKNPGQKVFHINGNFHSASHLGTVERLKERMPELKLAVVTPVMVDDNSSPVLSEEDAASGDYIILVSKVPDMFKSDERELEYQRAIAKERMGNECEYSAQVADNEEKS